MPKRYREQVTSDQLAYADIPVNHVLVEMSRQSDEGQTTKGGIITGFRTDETFVAGEHAADTAQVCGRVIVLPNKLYFDPDDENGMPWDCDMELQKGDMVFFSALESKNAVELECDGIVYRSIPYQDCFVAKRTFIWEELSDIGFTIITIPLNGFVLCEPLSNQPLGSLDIISKDQVDKTKGIIRFIGEPVKRYMREQYTDIPDLRVGDLVQFDPKTPLYYLERNKYTAVFNDDKLYFVVQRRRIALILERNG